MYKLADSHKEAINRRDLLKQTVGVAAGAMLPPGTIEAVTAPAKALNLTPFQMSCAAQDIMGRLFLEIEGFDWYEYETPEEIYEYVQQAFGADDKFIQRFKRLVERLGPQLAEKYPASADDLFDYYERVGHKLSQTHPWDVNVDILADLDDPSLDRATEEAQGILENFEQRVRRGDFDSEESTRNSSKAEPESTEADEFRESALASTSNFPRDRSEWLQ